MNPWETTPSSVEMLTPQMDNGLLWYGARCSDCGEINVSRKLEDIAFWAAKHTCDFRKPVKSIREQLLGAKHA